VDDMKSPKSKTRSILVTGGAGYIGSHTCKALAAMGFSPIVLDDLSMGHDWAVRWGPLVESDIADKARISQIISRYGIRAVIHFAARAYVGESMSKPREYFETNVSKALALFDVLLDCGIDKIVFSSSCATYGIPRELPIREDHPQEPINPYGASKLFIEQVLNWYGRAYGLRYAVLRYFNAAGADPDGEIGEDHVPETHLIPLVIAAARNKRPALEIFGTDYDTSDGTAVRDYVHVSDLADAHVRAINRLLASEQSIVVNLGTGRGHSIRQVVSAVEKVGGVRVPTVEAARRPGDPPTLVADPRQGQSLLGWSPSKSGLHDIIQSAWNWHTQHESR
jgi:UDP-arabinose 4-epimerase